jgi:hypothetical protein
MSEPNEELFAKLPAALQCYGVSLLWTLAALADAAPRLEQLLLKTLPPGSVDALNATGALTADRKLTSTGRELAKLAGEYRALVDEIDPSVDLSPFDAVQRVQASLRDHPGDMIRYDVSAPRASAR